VSLQLVTCFLSQHFKTALHELKFEGTNFQSDLVMKNLYASLNEIAFF